MIKEIQRLQDNLAMIRNTVGWTAEDLAQLIGVTKQTISNIENKRTLMTKTHYIAIRTILDYEESKGESDLLTVIMTCIYRDDANQDDLDLVSAYVIGSRKQKLSDSVILTGVVRLTGITPKEIFDSKASIANWLERIINKKEK